MARRHRARRVVNAGTDELRDALAAALHGQERPFERPILDEEVAHRFDFEGGTDGWQAAHATDVDGHGLAPRAGRHHAVNP